MAEFAGGGRGARPASDHRRRGRRGPPAGHGRRADPLPVLGVPVQSQALSGLDSLLSSRRCPAASPSARSPSARRARSTPPCSPSPSSPLTTRPARKACAFRGSRRTRCWGTRCHELTPHPPRRGPRRPRQRAVGPDVRAVRAPHGLPRPYLSPDNDTPTGQVADVEVVADYDDLDAVRAFARQRRGRDVRVRKRPGRDGGGGRRPSSPSGPVATSCTSRSIACARRPFWRSPACRTPRSAASRHVAELTAACVSWAARPF